MSEMIRFENVSKIYDGHGHRNLVLNNLNFTIGPRDRLGICGSNGAGKSTLIRMIAGVDNPTSGRVIRNMTTSWPLGYASAFQSSLTGADNCRFIARIYGKDIAKLTKFVEDFCELGPYFRQPVHTYSSGMGARFSFGISLAIDFDCYLIDEVTATGDERFRKKIEAVMDERKSKGALVMVSHVPQTLRAHCDKGAVLFNGALQFFDTIDEAIDVHNYYQRTVKSDRAVVDIHH